MLFATRFFSELAGIDVPGCVFTQDVKELLKALGVFEVFGVYSLSFHPNLTQKCDFFLDFFCGVLFVVVLQGDKNNRVVARRLLFSCLGVATPFCVCGFNLYHLLAGIR